MRFHESSLSFSLLFVSFRPFFAPKKETARGGRGGGESPQGGETMTWLTNGNSFPLLPRSRLIIFSETSTFNWCFLIDCPSPPAQERQKPSRREFRAAVIQFGKFLSRSQLPCERISVCPPPPPRELVKRVAEVGFIGYHRDLWLRNERRGGGEWKKEIAEM